MEKRKFFKGINFNKAWDENDWEKFFQAQDAYRLSKQAIEIRKKPLSRIKFDRNIEDEVAAFDPVLKAYLPTNLPPVIPELHSRKFFEDEHPEVDYHPAARGQNFWAEGAPLTNVWIYRDACRFAISVANEIDKFLKRRGPVFRKKVKAQFELLRFHAYWIAINIAEGHRVGYSADRIRGNIAKNLRAIKHADAAIGLISRISTQTRSNIFRRQLFSSAFQLRKSLYDRVDGGKGSSLPSPL